MYSNSVQVQEIFGLQYREGPTLSLSCCHLLLCHPVWTQHQEQVLSQRAIGMKAGTDPKFIISYRTVPPKSRVQVNTVFVKDSRMHHLVGKHYLHYKRPFWIQMQGFTSELISSLYSEPFTLDVGPLHNAQTDMPYIVAWIHAETLKPLWQRM